MPPSGLLRLLEGGDRRSIGRSVVVVLRVLDDPGLLPTLLSGLTVADPLIRMRAADALEKLDRERPGLLRPHRARLLRIARVSRQAEVQWHMAQLLPRLDLGPAQRAAARPILRRYLGSSSAIVQAMALDALVRLAPDSGAGRARTRKLLEAAATSRVPAVRARARRLRAELAGKARRDG